MAVTEGTAQGLSFPDLKNRRQDRHSRSGGKKISFTLGLSVFILTKIPNMLCHGFEKGPAGNTIGAPFVMKRFF